jgi:hypothetical protein
VTVERTAADWAALCAEYGRVYGDLLTYQRVVAEQAAELAALRAKLAAQQDALQGGTGP